MLIVEHRVLSRPPKALKEVAARFGVSRERIRYIQIRTERRIRTAFGHELRFLAEALKSELAPSAEDSAVHRRIDNLLPNSVGRTEELVKALFRQALLNEMGLLRACRSLRIRANRQAGHTRGGDSERRPSAWTVPAPASPSQRRRAESGKDWYAILAPVYGSRGSAHSPHSSTRAP